MICLDFILNSKSMPAQISNLVRKKYRMMKTVIVTGVANRTRKFDASFAVSNVTALAIQKLAPLNMADLLGQLPGVFAEA